MLLATVVAPTTVAPTPAAADDVPTTFDPRPDNRWGVSGLDLGSGNFRYYSPVFDFAQIGDTVYSGGKFTGVTDGNTTIDQAYLAAFDESGDTWRSAFRPDVDWSVFALETSADNSRLFVGGEFTAIGEADDTGGFAAIDPTTGTVDPTFGVSVRRTNNPARVHDLHREGEWLYIAGAFTRITGSDDRTYWVENIARVNAETGIVDASWRPRANNGAVWKVTPDPARDRVLLGGLFHEINGTTTQGFGIVDDNTGVVADYDYDFGIDNFWIGSGYIFASTIEVVGDRLILGGQAHRVMITTPDLETISSFQTNRFNATNGGRGGDTQAITVHDGTIYVACHCWGQTHHEGTDDFYDVRSVYAIDLATGIFAEDFAVDFSGSSGPWALHVDRDECLWVGTDAVQSGQAAALGAVRLCQRENLAPTIASVTSDGAAVPGSEGLTDDDLVTNWFDDHQGLSTPAAARPYIDIEFAEPVNLDRLTLWNRTDEGRDQLHDVHVWLSEEPFTTTDWAELRQDPAVTEIQRPGDHRYKRSLAVTVGQTVRHVRIQVDAALGDAGIGRLDLTELTVFGSLAPGPPVEPAGCRVDVVGDTATVGWDDDNTDHVIYRTVDDSPLYWRGRVGGTEFVDQLRDGVGHTYSVAAIEARVVGQTVTCEPGDVRVEANDTIELTSTRQTRDRIVLTWTPRTFVTVLRDGVEIGTDGDGWYTDRSVEPGTTYTYTVRDADGAEGTLTVATNP